MSTQTPSGSLSTQSLPGTPGDDMARTQLPALAHITIFDPYLIIGRGKGQFYNGVLCKDGRIRLHLMVHDTTLIVHFVVAVLRSTKAAHG